MAFQSTNKQVKFYKGTQAKYLASPSTFTNGVYFASDAKVIYLDGNAYGLSTEDQAKLANSFTSASYTEPSANGSAVLTLTKNNSNPTTIDLFRVFGSNAITATYNASTKGYDVALKIDGDDKVLQQTAAGLCANLSLALQNQSIKLYGKTPSGGSPELISSISISDLYAANLIKNVELVSPTEQNPISDGTNTYTSGNYLDFTFTRQRTGGGTEDFHVFVDVTSLADVYTAGGGIDITNNVVSVKVDSANSGGYIAVGANGIYLNGLEAKINGIENYTINGKAIKTNPVLTGTDVSLGNYTVAAANAGSITANDTVSVAIGKIMRDMSALASSATIQNIIAATGLASNGSLPNDSSISLASTADNTLIGGTGSIHGAVHALDRELMSVKKSIDGMDSVTTGSGNVATEVTETNGIVNVTKAQLADLTISGITSQRLFSTSSSMRSIVETVQDSICWIEDNA